MKKTLLAFILLFCAQFLFSIEIKFAHLIEEIPYEEYKQEALKRSHQMIHGVREISWVNKNQILYERDSVFVIHDTFKNNYTIDGEVGEKINSRFVSISPAKSSDFLLIESGDFKNLKYWIYSYQNGIKQLNSFNIFDSLKDHSIVITDKRGIGSYWEKSLLGGYSIVDTVVAVDFDTYFHEGEEFAVALKSPGTNELTVLPQEFHSARNNGNYTMTAVSFDRFHLAFFSDVILKEEYNGPRWKMPLKSGIFVFEIVYEGTLLPGAAIYESPSFDSYIISTIENENVVKVTDAENYEILKNGTEDFWYHIEDSELSGWIHGKDLLIENQTWEDRLEIRGPILTWKEVEELTKDP